MDSSTECLSGTTLASKPSTAFSTTQSVSSPKHTLLFGEVDSCNQSFKSTRSTCTLILCSSPAFISFWDNATTRTTLLSHLPTSTLSSLRLVCHGMNEAVTPHHFNQTTITFSSSTFAKTSRYTSLQRIGPHIKALIFRLPRNLETTLAPLIDPWTGEQRNFTWMPYAAADSGSRYGDAVTSALLVRQYPPLFHAAANVKSFVRFIACLKNLQHLKIECPEIGGGGKVVGGTDIVDYALSSLRIAVEEAKLRSLDMLTLECVRLSDVAVLSPLMGVGAHPGSVRCWHGIRVLEMGVYGFDTTSHHQDQTKLLRTYIRGFKNLERLSFRWIGARGPSPLPLPTSSSTPDPQQRHRHPAFRTTSTPILPHLTHLFIENAKMEANQIALLTRTHKHTLKELDLENIILETGTWEDALGELDHGADIHVKPAPKLQDDSDEVEDVPIMLAPSMTAALDKKQKHARCQANISGQSGAADAAREILLAGDRDVPQRGAEDLSKNKEKKKKKARDKEWLSSTEQLRKKCGDLFGWRLRN